MLKPLHVLGLAVVGALIMSFPTISYPYTGQELAPQAKVSLPGRRRSRWGSMPRRALC
jgi:hypothetical protein